MKWRKLNNILHRDIGYLCFGLTLVYIISGIAVNHKGDWNPSHKITQTEMKITPLSEAEINSEEFIKTIPGKLEIKDIYRSHFRSAPEILHIFFETSNLRINIITGNIVYEEVQSRHVLKEMNYLHLNQPKKLWTYFADLYAVALLIVAVTGLFVLKGKNGIKGRGSWLTAIGVVIPILVAVFYL